MTLLHILVDYENTQPSAQDVALVQGRDQRLWIFRGAGQKKYPGDFADALLALQGRASAIACARSGRNALDMHIVLHLGRLLGEAEAATADGKPACAFVIVSRDKDFEPALEYLRAQGIDARRVSSMREALGRAGERTSETKGARGKTASVPAKTERVAKTGRSTRGGNASKANTEGKTSAASKAARSGHAARQGAARDGSATKTAAATRAARGTRGARATKNAGTTPSAAKEAGAKNAGSATKTATKTPAHAKDAGAKKTAGTARTRKTAKTAESVKSHTTDAAPSPRATAKRARSSPRHATALSRTAAHAPRASADASAPRMSSPADALADEAAAYLDTHRNKCPRNRSRLEHWIESHYRRKLGADADVHAVVAALERRGVVAFDGNKVAYPQWPAAAE